MISGINNANFNPGNPAAAAVRRARDEGKHETFEALFVIVSRMKKKYIYCYNKAPSLGVFGTEHPLRRFAIWLTTSFWFDVFVVSIIVANCILLALNDPPEIPEYVFLGVYTIEMLLKIIALGFVRHRFTYLRDGWNRLDAVVILLGFIALIPSVGNLSGFRALRVLRALRAINTLPGLRVMVNSLLSSLQAIVSVFILMFCFIIMVAVLGLQLFSGVLRHKCVRELPMYVNNTNWTTNATLFNSTMSDMDLMTSLPVTSNVTDAEFAAFVQNSSNWQSEAGLPIICGNSSSARHCASGYTCLPDVGDNPRYGFLNFDNFGWSMLTSFQLVTSDNWEDVYNQILASQGAPISIIFFFFVIFLGFFYVLNLVLAIVTIAYNKEVEKEKAESAKGYGLDQNATGVDLNDSIHDTEEAEVQLDQYGLLELLRRVTLSIGFEVFIGLCIIINTVVLAIEQPFIDPNLGFALCVSNVIFTMIFMIEGLLKIFAFRGLPYFKSKWNVFDFLLVLISLSELVYIGVLSGTVCASEGAASESHIATALRTFRLLRVLKLARSWTTMKALLSIISTSMWDVGNLTMIMIIVIYTFALVGTHLFRHYYTPADLNKVGVERWNFSDFVHSCVTIFTILCGEWVLPLYDTMRVSSPLAILFFILVICVGNFLILNLFVALLLNSFNLENWQATVQKTVKKHQQQHATLDSEFLRRMNIPWLAKKLHHPSPQGSISISRTNSLPNVLPMVSKHSIDAILEVDDTREEALASCLAFHVSGDSFSTELERPKPRSHSFSGPYTLLMLSEGDEKPRAPVPPRVMLRLHPSLPVGQLAGSMSESAVSSRPRFPSLLNEEDILGVAPLTHSGCLPAMDNPTFVETSTSSLGFDGMVSMASSSGTPTTTARNCYLDPNIPDIRMSPYDMQLTATHRFRKASRQVIKKIKTDDAMPSKSNWSSHEPSLSGSGSAAGGMVASTKSKSHIPFVKRCQQRAYKTVTSAYFEYVVLILVIGSSISLAFEDSTVETASTKHDLLNIFNIFFACCFTAEMLLKWFGLGVRTYFKNSWNTLDFIIVLISLISIDYSGDGATNVYSGIRVIRTLRCLRPLRAISRWPSMKVVVNALISAIPSIANVLLVCLIFWLIFSIMGVQFFGGRFYSCIVNASVVNATEVPNKTVCENMYGNTSWKNAHVNYDNVVNAALALFQVATFEGWIEIMAASVDAVGLDQQPVRESNLYAYLFYVVFIIVGAFFTLNLFIGVIIDNFSRIRKDHANDGISGGGGARLLLTDDQQRWMSAMMKLTYAKPKRIAVRPTNIFQRACYHISKSPKFDVAITIVILLNLVVLAVSHHNQTSTTTTALYVLNVFFTSLYILEAVIKLVGLRYSYFLDHWNIFDFVILILSIAALILETLRQSVVAINPTTLRVIRVFRVIRLVRLIHHYRGIRKLIITLTYSLPALVNVGGLLLLMIYIYAILGINLFGHVKLTGALSDQVNFQTIGHALLVLFRLSTAAGWNDILNPMVIQPPDCDPNFKGLVNGNCGYPIGAPIYMVTFTIFTFLIILNLYVAIILENYVEVSEDSIFEDDVDAFYNRWAKYDPRATQFAPLRTTIQLIRGLKGALGVESANAEFLAELNLPVYDDHSIHCLDLLKGLVKMRLGMVDENEAMSQVISRLEDRFNDRFPRRTARQPVYHTSGTFLP